MTRITLAQPDDAHVHLRDGDDLRAVVVDTARRFARAIVMPNLKQPIITTAQALAYKQRIRAALPENTEFQPLMTLYLTERTSAEEIIRAKDSGAIYGVKLYPAGATTHSDAGVRDISACYDVFATMAEVGMPLLIHGEVTNPDVDVFDRERVFIESHLLPITTRFTNLRIVLEHITTRFAVEFVQAASPNLAATITAHHLILNRNAMFEGGIRPHFYCLPLLKREDDRRALRAAAISANPKFFLGTDSAPHASARKESSCGCAGIYTAHAGLELYAEVFEEEHALDKLEAFASFYAADFYGIPRNSRRVIIEKESWRVPDILPMGGASLIPFRAGELISWKLVEN